MSKPSKLIKNTTIYAIGDIVPRLLGFISFPILTTYLTPADYGIVSYVNTINMFLIVIGFMCVNTYYLVYYYRQDNEIEQKKLLGNLSIFILALNLFISLVLFLFGNYYSKVFGGNIEFYPYIAIGVATNFFNTFSILPSALYRLLEKPTLLVCLNIAKGVITLALTLLLVVKYNFTALGVLYSNLAVVFIFAFIFAFITFKQAIFSLNIQQLKKALKFSIPLVPGSIAYYLISMSDRILIDKYLTLYDLGIYSTAATLAMLLNIVSYGAYKAFEPYIFKLYGSENFVTAFQKMRDGFTILYLLGAMCLAVFGKEFFQIFATDKYNTAYIYVPLILIGVYISSLTMLYGTVITAREKTLINSMLTICGGVVSVVLNILLLPTMGLYAATLVSSLTYCLIYVVSIYYSNIRINQMNSLWALIIVSTAVYFSVYVLNIDSLIYSIIVKTVIISISMYIVTKLMNINLYKFILSLRR